MQYCQLFVYHMQHTDLSSELMWDNSQVAEARARQQAEQELVQEENALERRRLAEEERQAAAERVMPPLGPRGFGLLSLPPGLQHCRPHACKFALCCTTLLQLTHAVVCCLFGALQRHLGAADSQMQHTTKRASTNT